MKKKKQQRLPRMRRAKERRMEQKPVVGTRVDLSSLFENQSYFMVFFWSLLRYYYALFSTLPGSSSSRTHPRTKVSGLMSVIFFIYFFVQRHSQKLLN